MIPELVRQSAEEFQLKEAIAQRYAVDRESIILYQEIGLFLAELFKALQSPHGRIVAAAPAIAEIALAADRADAELIDSESNELCEDNLDSLKSKIKSSGDIIYLANPNRLTGATWANAQLKTLAALVSDGLLIVDEYYHDFSRLTALPLLNKYRNLILLRAFEDWTKASQFDPGYAIMSEQLLDKFKNTSNSCGIERAAAKKCYDIMADRNSCDNRIELIQKQALQVARELTKIGVKCQLCPTNFILLQAGQPGEIQEFLKTRGIKADSLVQGGAAQKYLRIQISGSDQDHRIIEAFLRMPAALLNSQAKQFRSPGTIAGSNQAKAKSTSI